MKMSDSENESVQYSDDNAEDKNVKNEASPEENGENEDEDEASEEEAPKAGRGRGRPKKDAKGRGRPSKGKTGDTPKKTPSGKGRGRPPKDKSEVKSNESKDDSKKGRGRPPKEDSDSPVLEKKGRGRPAKTEGASPAKSPKISSKSPGSGKGRGRPSKNNDSEKPAKDKSEKSSTPDDNFSESEPSIEMTKKRKRESDDEDSEECSLLQKKRKMFSNILAHNKIKCVKYEEAQKKRGRGRPKKSKSNSKKEKSKKVYVEEIILPKDKSMEKAEPLPSKRHEKPKVIHVEIAKPETPEEEYELMEVVNEPLEVENFSHISTQIPFQERKKQRKQIIPSSTPLPKSNNRNSHLNICGLTPIPQEQSEITLKEESPKKPSFSYLLRSPEIPDEPSTMDETQDEESSWKNPERSRKSWNRKSTLESTLEQILENNDEEVNEKLSQALEENRNQKENLETNKPRARGRPKRPKSVPSETEEIHIKTEIKEEKLDKKENCFSSLTKALEVSRGRIQKEIEANKPRGRGRPKGSKNPKPATSYVTVLTADDDFQDERYIDISNEIKSSRKNIVRNDTNMVPANPVLKSPPKILQKARDSEAIEINVKIEEEEQPKRKVLNGSLAELLRIRAEQKMSKSEEQKPKVLRGSLTELLKARAGKNKPIQKEKTPELEPVGTDDELYEEIEILLEMDS